MSGAEMPRTVWPIVLPIPEGTSAEWLASVRRMVQRGTFTEAQVTQAVRGIPVFKDAWDERNRDDS